MKEQNSNTMEFLWITTAVAGNDSNYTRDTVKTALILS
jgi:hypothetical protein